MAQGHKHNMGIGACVWARDDMGSMSEVYHEAGSTKAIVFWPCSLHQVVKVYIMAFVDGKFRMAAKAGGPKAAENGAICLRAVTGMGLRRVASALFHMEREVSVDSVERG